MRNPLTRLVHRAPAKPTLRERLTATKAKAQRVFAVNRILLKPEADAEFLALAPTILPLLDRFDAMWAAGQPFFEAAQREAEARGLELGTTQTVALPSWLRWVEAAKAANVIGNQIDAIVQPHMDTPATTLDGLILKARIAATLRHYQSDAGKDLVRLMKARFGDVGEAA